MNKEKNYKIIYIISSILTIIGSILFITIVDNTYNAPYILLIMINILMFILFIIMNRKRKLKKSNIVLPIIYIIFLIIMLILSFVINNYTLVKYIHFPYYFNFVLVADVMLNIYTLLCLSK